MSDKLLDYVPRFMRGWPLLSRFYWQAAELQAAEKLGKEIAEKLRWEDEGEAQDD